MIKDLRLKNNKLIEGGRTGLFVRKSEQLIRVIQKSPKEYMEVQTIQKYLHTSPRKLRLVADLVRKMTPAHALGVLKVTPKYAAKDLEKAIETVLANAKQKGMNADALNFKKLEIDESTKMRRFHAGTRGRVKPFKRRMAHIKIVLSDELRVQSKTEESKVKTEKSETKEKV